MTSPIDRHDQKAKRLFGGDAYAERKESTKIDTGRMRGRCGTCMRPGCRRKWTMTIAKVELGWVHVVLGRAHTWTDAWTQARKRLPG